MKTKSFDRIELFKLTILVGILTVTACINKNDVVPGSFFGNMPSAKQMEHYRKLIQKRVAKKLPVTPIIGTVATAAEEMIRTFNLLPNDVVADIGCGTGFLEMGLLEYKSPFQKCYAVDIDQIALDFLDFVLKTTNYPDRNKIEILLSTMTDTRLAPNSIDVALIINTTAFDAQIDEEKNLYLNSKADQCLMTIFQALKPGGRVVYYFHSPTEPADPERFKLILGGYQLAGFTAKEKEIRFFNSESYFYVLFEKPVGGEEKPTPEQNPQPL